MSEAAQLIFLIITSEELDARLRAHGLGFSFKNISINTTRNVAV